MLVKAQQGDSVKEKAVIDILKGDQGEKFVDAAKEHQVCVPSGKYLRQLLREHLVNREQLDQEIRGIIEEKLVGWKKEILGE